MFKKLRRLFGKKSPTVQPFLPEDKICYIRDVYSWCQSRNNGWGEVIYGPTMEWRYPNQNELPSDPHPDTLTNKKKRYYTKKHTPKPPSRREQDTMFYRAYAAATESFDLGYSSQFSTTRSSASSTPTAWTR